MIHDMPYDVIVGIIAENIEESKAENPNGVTKDQFSNFFLLLIEKTGFHSNAADFIACTLDKSPNKKDINENPKNDDDENKDPGLILHEDVSWFFDVIKNKDLITIHKLLFIYNNPKCMLNRPLKSLIDYGYAVCPDKEKNEIEDTVDALIKKNITRMTFEKAYKQFTGNDLPQNQTNPYKDIPVKYVEYIEPEPEVENKEAKDGTNSKCCLLL